MGNKSRQHSTQDEAVKAGHSKPAAPPAHLRTPSWYQIAYNLAASHANRALAQPREGGEDRRKDLIEAGHGGAEVAEAAAWAAKWSKGRPDQDWVGRLVYTRKPEPLRVRDQGFEHFLEETVEPCGLILWAGMLVELRSPDGATPDKSPEWKPRWRGDSGPFVFWTEPEALIQRVVKRPSLSYRAHYNLACFYADQQPDEALQELRLTLAELRGHRRDRTAALAWADPSLASLHQLEQFAAIVGPEPARVRVDQAELGGIAVIGTDAAKLLSQERIRSAEDLLELSERPTELAKALGIGPELLQLWRGAASLAAVRGIGVKDANLLLAAGISSSSDLAQRNPQRVLSLLSDVNRFQHVVERLPSLSEITAWIEEAHR